MTQPYLNHRILADICRREQPKRYLEIGVYLGDSLKAVLRNCTPEYIVLCDLWDGYREVRNRDHIAQILSEEKISPTAVKYLDGDSHVLIPTLAEKFDLIHVDGDHSESGALADLKDTWSLLEVGGNLVFDDLLHRFQPHMADVFRRFSRSLGDSATVTEWTDLAREDGWADGCGVLRKVA